MDMVLIFSVSLVPIIMFTIIPTGLSGNANMCQNDTYTSTNYKLSRVPGEPINCTCLLKSTSQTNITKVMFNISPSLGCRYKLGVYSKKKLSIMSCDSRDPVFYTITRQETIKLNLEPYQKSGSGTTFIMNITSTPETNITMSCSAHNGTSQSTSLLTTVLSSTTSKTTITTSSELTATISTSREPTTSITTSSELRTTNTTAIESSTQPSTVNISSTQPTTTNSSESSTTEPNGTVSSTSTTNYTESSTINSTTLLITDPGEQKYIIEIVGGATGCSILIACIFLIVCVIKRKHRIVQKRKEYGLSSKIIVDSDLEMTRKTNERTFNNVNTENDDSTHPEMITIPNDLYVSIHSVQQPTFHLFDERNPEMEIIENDLYVSSDSVRKDNDNLRPEMEIIENDLYVSSDILRKDLSTDNNNPKPEMEVIENDLYVSSDILRKDHLTGNNPKPEMEIIENDLYVSSDNLLKEHSSDTVTPHYYVVCPTCDDKGYEA